MRRHGFHGILIVAAVVLPLRAATGQPRSDDRELIRRARVQQNEAIARNDLAAVARFWTKDVNIRAGLGRSIQGRDAYQAAFRADSLMMYRREPTEIVVSKQWPLAYERGKWSGRLRADPAKPLLGGEYSAQWVKSGEQWLIRSEIFVALECSPPACGWPFVVP